MLVATAVTTSRREVTLHSAYSLVKFKIRDQVFAITYFLSVKLSSKIELHPQSC